MQTNGRPRVCLLSVAMAVLSCSWAAAGDPPALHRIPPDTLPAELPLDVVPAGLELQRPVPAGNELTPARVQLGRRLFFEPRLSRDGKLACASCHNPEHAFASQDAKAIGIDQTVGPRNAPSIFNRAYGRAFFWDGRAPTLESQALQPIANPIELAVSVDTVVSRLREDPSYREAFADAYGEVSPENLARAIASFERVLLTGNSPVDRFRASEFSALSDGARQGLWLFESRAKCWRCHSGHNFSDESFHNTGVSWGREPLDLGRYAITQNEADRGKFHTPSLRDVARTAPYMHDGSLVTLHEVVEFYNRGGQQNPQIDPLLAPLGLNEAEVGFLVEFLEALSGERPWQIAAKTEGK